VAVTEGGKVDEEVLPRATLTGGWSGAKTQVIWYKPATENLSIPVEAVNWVTACAASGVNAAKLRW
jgi:hypothetical protein